MKENMLACIIAYSDKTRNSNWWSDFHMLAEDLSTSFNWSYTDIGISLKGKNLERLKERNSDTR